MNLNNVYIKCCPASHSLSMWQTLYNLRHSDSSPHVRQFYSTTRLLNCLCQGFFSAGHQSPTVSFNAITSVLVNKGAVAPQGYHVYTLTIVPCFASASKNPAGLYKEHKSGRTNTLDLFSSDTENRYVLHSTCTWKTYFIHCPPTQTTRS